MIADRRAIAAICDKGLREFKNLNALLVHRDGVCSYCKYIAVLREKRNRKELKAMLRERYGVSPAGEVYDEPLRKKSVFEKQAAGPLLISEDRCSRHICFPVFSGMQQADAHQVLHAMKEVIGQTDQIPDSLWKT